jgi:putative phosphoesterase
MKVAIIADIHGNLPAFEAVLAHARARDVEIFWNLGDMMGYGPFPDQVVRLLKEKRVINILGNFDREVLKFPEKRKKWRKAQRLEHFLAYHWVHDHLSRVSRDYLKELPKHMRLRMGEVNFLLTHGSPEAMDEVLTADTPEERFLDLAADAGTDVVLCGHSHQAFCRQVNGTYFMNPGSVGRPRDGDPRASYALLDLDPTLMKVGEAPALDLDVRHVRLEYDVQKTLREVRSQGLPEAFAQVFLQGRELDAVLQEPDSWDMPQKNDQAWWEFSFVNIPLWKSEEEDERLEAVIKLAESYTYNIQHVHQVARLTLRLYDELQPLHRMRGRERFWLQCAALLHDIGKPQGNKGHHKVARDIILETPHLPFDERERYIIGSIARYHRKAWPKDKHDHFAALTPIDQRLVTILSAILRVADGLDSPRRSNVEEVTCDFSPDDITIKCTVEKKAQKERKRALKKGKLLEFAFDRKLFIEWHRPR